MVDAVPTTVDELQTQADARSAVGDWQGLRAMATAVIEAATARGEDVSALLSWAWAYRAGSSRQLDDVRATIEGWRRAIAAAPDPEAAHVSPFHGNLAAVLLDVDQVDEALHHLEVAERLEPTRDGQLALAGRRAGLLSRLGEHRAAVSIHRDVLDVFARDGVTDGRVPRTLDCLAAVLADAGELATAAELHEQAAAMFPDDDLDARLRNAISRVTLAGELRGTADAEYADLLDVATEWAVTQVDPQHYEAGFHRAAPARTEAGFTALIEGQRARDRGDVQEALRILDGGSRRAAAAGDVHFALRLRANLADLLSELGDLDQATAICWEVVAASSQQGESFAEAMARRQLATLASRGVPIGRTPSIGLLVMARRLDDLQVELARAAGVGDEALEFWRSDPSGVLDNEIGVHALDRSAPTVAVAHFRRAADRARELGFDSQYATRIANILIAHGREDEPDDEAAEQVAAQLRAVLDEQAVSSMFRARALMALGVHLARRADEEAAPRLREGVAIVEQLRAQAPPGADRAAVQREFRLLHQTLAAVLRRDGQPAEAFDVMARVKGRRVLDVLSARAGAADDPATAQDVQRWIGGGLLPDETVVVDLVVEPTGLAAHLVWREGAAAVEVDGPGVPALLSLERGEASARAERIVRTCREHPLVGALVDQIESRIVDEVGPDASVLLVPDGILANLPLHAVEVDGEPWYARRRIGWTPSIGAMPFFADAPSSPTAVVFGDSGAAPRDALPGAAAECRAVAAMLDADPLVGPDSCSREALAAALGAGDHDVVHLAVHGRADPHAGARSGLLVGPDDWMTFDELVALPWRARLVVFSGCSTAASSPRYAGDMLDVATAAAEAGAATVIASLWPIDDEAARVFMEAFHGWWAPRRATGADLREGMAVARDELRRWLGGRTSPARAERSRRRDGRTLSLAPPVTGQAETTGPDDQALDWAPFVLLGDPYAGTRSDPT